VRNFDSALDHIAHHSLKHSEAIITENSDIAQRFLQTVDAACVYWNTSTQFSDGAQFGLGTEIGISTQKLHVRGPFALEGLTSYKWIIEGNGQIRDN
ncbi:gamma-glutamyl-phosphate reductase, partial [Candidatus Peregrinibacteria bacterium]|nr:gamma-glutamyl-phosphate reductase [Candidatus Peregrinibacteria bacterium]